VKSDGVSLKRATVEDVETLTAVQTRTFVDDRRLVPPGGTLAGPPGFDSVTWNRRVIENDRAAYYKVLLGEKIIGGLILIDAGNGKWELGRIYIDPGHQNRGFGQQTVRRMYRLHPHVRRWRLGTPEWASRNRHFYEKMGFTIVEITGVDPNPGWRSVEYENGLAQEEREQR